jgi:rare lipoprotein A
VRFDKFCLGLLLVATVMLSGCVGSLPTRTGYDRNTGTWKVPHGAPAGAGTAASKAPPAGSVKMTDSTAPAGKLPDGAATIGQASWYGSEAPNAKTASGEVFVASDKTAAHRTLPFGTKLRVRYPKRGTQVEVRVNDRGPHKEERIIDLSEGAAEALGLKVDGVGDVWLDVLP